MKTINSRCLVIFGLLSTALILTEHALACSCARSGAVDEAFSKTPNVIVMKLRSVEKYTDLENGYGYGGIKQVKLTVERVFKGNLKVGQELTFAQGGGGDCVWTFNEESTGSEYLFYLGDKPVKPGLWVAGTCSRSRSLGYAAGDLLYLEKIEKVRGKTRLSGTVAQRIDSPIEEQPDLYQNLEGRVIRVSGNGKNIELKTDKNGVYETYDLPPGKYTVTPELIDGYKFGYGGKSDSINVEINPNRHTEQDFTFIIDNAIAGRFFDIGGRPLKNVCLRLRPAYGHEARGLFEMDCTDEKGNFRIDEIPAGTYVLVVNEDGKVTSDQPFGTFYYPSAKKREDAAELTVGPGVFRENLIITAPETAEVITVSGVLLLEDGKRASPTNTRYVSIEFVADKVDPEAGKKEADNEKADSRANIDENGGFRIRILKGQKGRLFASIMTFKGEYENCPRMDKLISDSGVEMPTIRSSEIRIDAANDLADVELKFPFPNCRRARIN